MTLANTILPIMSHPLSYPPFLITFVTPRILRHIHHSLSHPSSLVTSIIPRHIHHPSSHPSSLVTSVIPRHIRHSRESGNPDYPEQLDSRFRGNDVISKQIPISFAYPFDGQPNYPERPLVPPESAPTIPMQARHSGLAAPIGRKRLFSGWTDVGLQLVVTRL